MKKIFYFTIFILLTSITPVFADSILPLSYGIPILLPIVILIEILVFWLLNKKFYKKEISIKRIILIVLLANLVSSLLGVFIEFYTLPLGLSLDFLSNFVISVIIESSIFLIILKKTFKIKDLLTICIIVNIFSYAFIFFSYSYLTQRETHEIPMSLKQSIAMQTQFKIENASFYQNTVKATIRNIGTVDIDLGGLEFYINGKACPSYIPNSGNLTPNSTANIKISNTTTSCPSGVLTIVTDNGIQDFIVISC